MIELLGIFRRMMLSVSGIARMHDTKLAGILNEFDDVKHDLHRIIYAQECI